jgi:hypothetical protein
MADTDATLTARWAAGSKLTIGASRGSRPGHGPQWENARAKHARGRLERETGLEPATFSLEGLSVYALWHRAQRPERNVSSYRVFTRGAK